MFEFARPPGIKPQAPGERLTVSRAGALAAWC